MSEQFTNIIDHLQNYMFTSKNIIRFTKQIKNKNSRYNNFFNSTQTQTHKLTNKLETHKLTNKLETHKLTNKLETHKTTNKIETHKLTNKVETNNSYRPTQIDSLFWCFYILKNGFSNYEMEIKDQYFSVEKNEKFKYIELLRQNTNKQLLKLHKIKPFSEIEDDLANQTRISTKTFFSLCIVENINVLLVDNRKVYELLCNDINDSHPLHVVHRNNKTYEHFIELDLSQDTIKKYRETYYKVTNYDDTLKAISSYKLEELVDLCNKLNINIESINKTNTSDKTSDKTSKKKLTKKDIYEILVLNY